MSATEPLTERQAEIVRVATGLFAEHGYRAVGMRTIAKTVGVRTSSLYYHFSSKESLLYAITLDVTRTFLDEHLPLLSGPGSAAERLASLIRAHVVYFACHRLQQSVVNRELRELSPEHLQETVQHGRDYQRVIQRFIAEGVESDEFHVEDPRVAGIALLDMINGINRWLQENGRLSIEELAEEYAGLSLQLLGSGAPVPVGS